MASSVGFNPLGKCCNYPQCDTGIQCIRSGTRIQRRFQYGNRIQSFHLSKISSSSASSASLSSPASSFGKERRSLYLQHRRHEQLSSMEPQQTESDSEGSVNAQSLSSALPFIVAGTAASALIYPPSFSWVSKELYAPALGGIMLSIGVQLSIEDFALAFQRAFPLTIGYLAQYLLKPMLGFAMAKMFRTPPVFAAGLILTACVSGAQLSSYASFLSNGDVALSIVLTSFTTISSVIITPLLTGLLIGSVVPVDALAMSKSILQVVFLPIAMGLALNTYAKSVVTKIQPFMPFVAMFCTSLCIGSPLAINRSKIISMQGLQLLPPVLAFHTFAFIVGFWIAKLLGLEEDVCKTISLCTGMQSSTLAGLLATQFLGSTNAVPAACSVVAMAIMGLSLASFWGKGYKIKDIPSLFFQTAPVQLLS